jgi:hypothetical protein
MLVRPVAPLWVERRVKVEVALQIPSLISRSILIVVAAMVVLVVAPLSAGAAPGGEPVSGSGTTCTLPGSDAEALVILSHGPGLPQRHR